VETKVERHTIEQQLKTDWGMAHSAALQAEVMEQ